MARSHDVRLKLGNGRELDIWDEYTIVQDMLNPGSPWTFSLFYSDDAESTWQVVQDEVRAFDDITITIDGAVQLNGEICHVEPAHNREHGAGIVVSGNDLAGSLMLFDANPRVSLRSTNLSDIIHDLIQPFGMDVVIGADASAVRLVQQGRRTGTRAIRHTRPTQRVDRFHPKLDEKVWTVIEELCRREGYYVWVAPDETGKLSLVIDNPITAGLVEHTFVYAKTGRYTVSDESNVISAKLPVDVRGVPTVTYVYGHGAHGDAAHVRSQGHHDNDRFDTTWTKTDRPIRPRYMRADRARTISEMDREATRTNREAMINHKFYECVVNGHTSDVMGGEIVYAVNTMCHVRDDVLKVDDNMVLTRVQFEGGRTKGTLTTCRLHPLGALNLPPAS